MSTLVTGFLAIFSLLSVLLSYRASSDIAQNLSPQGCRMSWMSPSYVQQSNFDSGWSPLARRYSLWLYREVGWDSNQGPGKLTGSLPVLFIPGNAGSSHQVRSIASSATRQYYSSPYVVSHDFESRSLRPLDFFAVEFNEDLSAFHGSTLQSQISYTSKAIEYILSLYPAETKIIIMGHSMGGIVATSLLPSNNISTIITMSTPHTLPPARFDSRIDTLYGELENILKETPTPIVSICGGATDMMIPSESCILPRSSTDVFRRTVFTSALEGAWTGVGHREMVWCHQVRWRIARAALELGDARTLSSQEAVLDRWLRDGHTLPPNPAQEITFDISDPSRLEALSPGQNLVLRQPFVSKGYILPVPEDSSSDVSQKITVLVSQGSILSVGPQNPISLRLSIFSCVGPTTSPDCAALKPETLKLIPNPAHRTSFPVPQEGSDESEGVVLYESHIPRTGNQRWICVKVDRADGRGWIVAGLSSNIVVSKTSMMSIALKGITIPVPADETLTTSYTFPNLLSNALVVYRVTIQRYAMPSCSADALLPPLLMHTSHPTETHYFPLANVHNPRILLHTHLAAPFISQAEHSPSYLNFTIISSGEPTCKHEFIEFKITIDWSATLGRWASRYLHTLVSWAAGVASLVVFIAWAKNDGGVPMFSVEQSLTLYSSMLFRYLLPVSFVFSFIPLPETLYLGNKGDAFLAPIAPLVLTIASGLVCTIWWFVVAVLYVLGKTSIFFFGSRIEKSSVPRSTLVSLSIICIVIFVFVPWQVAYLGCWLLHLHTCATSMQYLSSTDRKDKMDAVPLVRRSGRESTESDLHVSSVSRERQNPDVRDVKRDNANHSMHLLLLMTWLLPLTAPVLAVWVRTLLTAGYTTPFDGDHNFLAVLPFLIFVDFASWTPGQIFNERSLEKWVPLRWLFFVIAGTAFIFGSRKPFLVLDVARVAMWVVVICRIGRRYWNGSP